MLNGTGVYGEYELLSDDRVVTGTRFEGFGIHIETVVELGLNADVVVLGQNPGAASFPMRYQFVLVPNKGLERASESSTTCSDIILEMRVSRQEIEHDLPPMHRSNLSHFTLRYDGSELEQIEVLRDDFRVPVVGAGAEVTRWVGVSAFEILNDPSERQRFATIINRDALFQLVEFVALSPSLPFF